MISFRLLTCVICTLFILAIRAAGRISDQLNGYVPLLLYGIGALSYKSPIMNEIKLVRPSVEFKDSFLESLIEFQNEGLPWVMDLKVDELRRDFDRFVQAELNKRTLWTKDTPVDETELWAVLGDVYVGRISIRHKLNADLQIMGGHIGYDTRPTYRGRGIASAMLRLAMPVAKRLGIQEALLTCNESNLPSIKVIEKNGGILKETKPQFEGGPIKRYYWIQL